MGHGAKGSLDVLRILTAQVFANAVVKGTESAAYCLVHRSSAEHAKRVTSTVWIDLAAQAVDVVGFTAKFCFSVATVFVHTCLYTSYPFCLSEPVRLSFMLAFLHFPKF